MSDQFIPDVVVRHAGLVLTHSAVVASVLEDGQLICPFAVATKGDDRQTVEFEAATQDEAVSKGWSHFEEWKEHVDLWALAREGLVPGPNGKDDVLVVAAWTRGMVEPLVVTQRFLPKAKGGFALVGPVEIGDLPPADIDRIGRSFLEGVHEHPKGHLWNSWHGNDA
jgi:hypothetical protein